MPRRSLPRGIFPLLETMEFSIATMEERPTFTFLPSNAFSSLGLLAGHIRLGIITRERATRGAAVDAAPPCYGTSQDKNAKPYRKEACSFSPSALLSYVSTIIQRVVELPMPRNSRETETRELGTNDDAKGGG
ncbi:uncharacterized protein CLUP02_09717 [Colletotrichum lupini]|uniref:Uncharacterized protein n=1 Tax=Colletotrichum lupini TaxID=145971 RepID=A0A9Q8SWW7_9PEZI|nr:uncharacterized protein CLUP02_09717 [Colletotrichum lupini]UQC84221.1 hypothetical protein CLUP02_09717 [Colletotrichum lupini]